MMIVKDENRYVIESWCMILLVTAISTIVEMLKMTEMVMLMLNATLSERVVMMMMVMMMFTVKVIVGVMVIVT